MTKIEKRVSEIERTLAANKTILNADEAAAYLNFSKSYLYKLTHKKKIAFSRPNGKKIFFDRATLDAWLMQNPVMTNEQLDCAASTHVTTH